MGEHEERRIRENAARLALAMYVMTVAAAILGIVKLIHHDTNSAVAFALSAVLTLVSAIASTMRTRGY